MATVTHTLSCFVNSNSLHGLSRGTMNGHNAILPRVVNWIEFANKIRRIQSNTRDQLTQKQVAVVSDHCNLQGSYALLQLPPSHKPYTKIKITKTFINNFKSHRICTPDKTPKIQTE